ncbi:MAG: glycosyltransferase [Verrucomicrobiales bacterium]|nr:glycosyltransferase [Verrucomicrobiales bacterium]
MSAATVKFSVLVNNHNYARYLSECLDSALAQTLPAHEIIVVDDGSTDDSLAVLRRYANRQRVKIIAQQNAGQFAAIAAGIEAADGDVLCFLDADDSYKPNYLRELGEIYCRQSWVDLVFCRFEPVGGDEPNQIKFNPDGDYDYGYTTVQTYLHFRVHRNAWIGNVTSCVSMRKKTADVLQLREVAASQSGNISADYALLAGGALVGARKYYLARTLVNYRLHGQNRWAATKGTPETQYEQHLLKLKIFNFYRKRLFMEDDIARYLDLEIQTIPAPLPAHLEFCHVLEKDFGNLLKQEGK